MYIQLFIKLLELSEMILPGFRNGFSIMRLLIYVLLIPSDYYVNM